jgi:DNA replication protein DnaC
MDDWTQPSYLALARNPALLDEYRARKAAWLAANEPLCAAWDEALAEEQRRAWALQEAAQRVFALRNAGLPQRAIEAWQAGLRPTKGVEAVRTFVASGKTFLLLLGSPGCGKTVATAEALTRGGCFFRAIELARLSSFDKEDRATFQDAAHIRTLVLDDLGAELLHDGWRPMLDELVDIRYGNRAQTVITSNLDAKAFKERYGERIADRVRHDGFIVTCGDKSERRQP